MSSIESNSSKTIEYKTVDQFPGWDKAREFLLEMVKKNNAKNILEIGSGANPTLTEEDIKVYGLKYTTNDVDEHELSKAGRTFSTLQFDFTSTDLPEELYEKYDLVFSRMVNEHVRSGHDYYSNIFKILRPGGITVHCFSTLYAFPFVANWALPEKLTDRLLSFFAPRKNVEQHGKFKAYYSWSRGPTSSSVARLTGLGFRVDSYIGYFGHSYYKSKLPFLHALEMKKSKLLRDYLKLPYLTAYASIVLSKDEEDTLHVTSEN